MLGDTGSFTKNQGQNGSQISFDDDFLNDYDDDKIANVLLNMPVQDDVGLKQKLLDNWDYFSRKWIDSGTTIKTFAKEINDPYLYAYYDNAKKAKTQALYHIEEEQRDINNKVVGKGLLKIFEPIIAKGGDYQQNFSDYLFHKHNVDRMKVNKAVFADSVTGADSQVEVDKFEKTNPEFIKYANEGL